MVVVVEFEFGFAVDADVIIVIVFVGGRRSGFLIGGGLEETTMKVRLNEIHLFTIDQYVLPQT